MQRTMKVAEAVAAVWEAAQKKEATASLKLLYWIISEEILPKLLRTAAWIQL